tara:strand:+ start:10633 stop:10821 length:189 start_codon:yes stop_codon:yes gene_type:complete
MRKVRLHHLNNLANKESPNEIVLNTDYSTSLLIEKKPGYTSINVAKGNTIEIIGSSIFIKDA